MIKHKMTVHELIEEFLLAMEGTLSSSTIKWYGSYLESLDLELGSKKADQVTVSNLRSLYRETRERDISPFSKFNFVRCWKRVFRWGSKEGLIKNNPAQELQLPPLPQESPKAISKEDASRLVRAAANESQRDYAILLFFVETGARLGGVADLRLNDLDIDQLRAIVREKGRGGKKERVVFFGERTANALLDWLSIRPSDKSDRVFLLKEYGIYQVIERLALKEEIKGRWNPHSFRHAFARNLLKNGASLAVVSHLMGHTSVGVTVKFYGRFAEDELQKFHEKYVWVPED
jgi:site-specific recombinase XerD